MCRRMNYQWIHQQFGNIKINDSRLRQRAVTIANACAERPEKSFCGRFEDWAGLKAAYRFFSNPKVTHQILQEQHYREVLARASWSEELVLFIQDGSELLFNSHPCTYGLGATADSVGNGLMFHSCLVAKYHDEPKETEILGLSYQEVWIRPEEKEPAKHSKKKESEVWLRTLEKSGPPQKNWVSIGDRGNDIYDFLHKANGLGWNFVVRARHDRKVEIDDVKMNLFPWIRQQTAKCKSKLFLRARGQEFSGEVELEISWTKAKLFPPGQKASEATDEVTYMRVWCPDRLNLEWLLVTNLPVETEADVLRIVEIYRRRWLIEDYHKAVKTGFRIEESQLKQAIRILALFGLIGVIATQLLAMRELCRLSPERKAHEVVPKQWIIIIERYLRVKLETVRDFWRSVARLGGFIGRKSDGEPGWQTIWIGYARLRDMSLGADLFGQ